MRRGMQYDGFSWYRLKKDLDIQYKHQGQQDGPCFSWVGFGTGVQLPRHCRGSTEPAAHLQPGSTIARRHPFGRIRKNPNGSGSLRNAPYRQAFDPSGETVTVGSLTGQFCLRWPSRWWSRIKKFVGKSTAEQSTSDTLGQPDHRSRYLSH